MTSELEYHVDRMLRAVPAVRPGGCFHYDPEERKAMISPILHMLEEAKSPESSIAGRLFSKSMEHLGLSHDAYLHRLDQYRNMLQNGMEEDQYALAKELEDVLLTASLFMTRRN